MTDLFKKEIGLNDTRYFIFDTGRKSHKDVDFKKYSWRSKKINLARPSDLFLYRTPQKVSESGQFFFFGVCKIGRITQLDKTTGLQFASFSKAYPFQNLVFQKELENYEWTNKKKN